MQRDFLLFTEHQIAYSLRALIHPSQTLEQILQNQSIAWGQALFSALKESR